MDFLRQTESLGKLSKKIIKVSSISSKGFTVLQNYKIEDIFQHSEIITVSYELLDKTKKSEPLKMEENKSVKNMSLKEKEKPAI